MSRGDRVGLIKQIEEARGSRVLAYVLSDRPGPAAQIGQDAVRPMYQHLRDFTQDHASRVPRLDLFLYSRGGDVSVPWRIVSMIRECVDEFNVLVPYKAHSAATMIALGADAILMGPKAELGPIDPSLRRPIAGETAVPPQEIGVEDVVSYVNFMTERARITDQTALATLMQALAGQIGPVSVGSANREYSHIRLVARKLLGSRRSRLGKRQVDAIVDALTEKMYSHGHGIGRTEAKEVGLQVEEPELEVADLIWQLFVCYEERLLINEPLDAAYELEEARKEEVRFEDVAVAAIESRGRCHLFTGDIRLRRKRQLPVQANLNIGVQAPPGRIDHAALQQLMARIGEAVRQQLIQQAPVVGIEGGLVGGQWRDVTGEET